MAIASAAAERKLDENAVVFGEVGLGGEIRSVVSIERRVNEAKKLGFTTAIGPKSARASGVTTPVSDLRQALIDYLK